MLQVVECGGCGFTDLGSASLCPDCGGPLRAQTHDEDDEEPLFALNLVDSGEVTYQAHLQHCVAYLQLREICEAADQELLSEPALHFLLNELQSYLEQQLDDLASCDLIGDGLRWLAQACDLARLGQLGQAERVAAQGNVWVGQGRQLLARRAA